MDQTIKVSIILPAYNAEKTLKTSIESVLNQTYKNFELLIINDGSTDTTDTIIRSFEDSRIVYIKNSSNIGLIETLNKAFSHSTGTHIARIDADDYWSDKNKISKQISFLSQNPDYVLIGTQAQLKVKNKNKKTDYPLSDTAIRKKILSKNIFIHSSVMFKKQFTPTPPYNKEDYLLEDYALWLRLGLTGKLANLPDFSVEYFVNPNGETQKHNLEQTLNSLELIKKFKKQYPNYVFGYLVWSLKIIIRKLFIHLK